MPVEIKVYSEATQKALAAIGRRLPEIAGNVLTRLMVVARNIIRRYPPELPGQKYVRTQTYYYSSATQAFVRGGNIAVAYRNDATQFGRAYPVYVGGDANGQGQAAIHVGRWPVAREVIDREVVAEFTGEFATEAQRVIDSEGL